MSPFHWTAFCSMTATPVDETCLECGGKKMNILGAGHAWVHRWFDAISNHRLIGDYVRGERIPWSKGYSQYRAQSIATALADAELLVRFGQSEPLPPGYGIRIDERCVEYPWIISQLEPGPACCLDAGSALNYAHILDHPVFSNKKLHILTLAPEHRCFWRRSISYLYEDLRQIPIRDSFYDVVVSISTLEHVGFDNSHFTSNLSHVESRPDDYVVAVRELWRVLKPGGQLLITVPFGIYSDFGAFQQFDLASLKKLESSVEPIGVEHTFYRCWNHLQPFARADREDGCSMPHVGDKKSTRS
ncbi:methyltransferase domain-containing protein [Chloroflexota bacterium]